ncbi:nuclear transport factor 2 family protein [Microbispora bryophytorum]|uniref:Nuclear transport factor 2 family protein n=1 Tax=Microbispora bryophytorum subsp. camponoti TaxID=1677852 RepID=A0ABR8LAQ5_9ACTN|nr:nuclear transport factor 2 family protein [Microbispora camponoti]MBD3147967.1 nuclear transport factor 2 family protein [Microbispora camponoti]
MDEIAALVDRAEIVDVVTAVFDTVDAKNWPVCLELFDDEVDADFSSLNGGGPARITAEALVDGWRIGLHAQKQSFHSVSNFAVTVDGAEAHVTTKGYSYNLLDAALGGGMFEVWGVYRLRLVRQAEGWKVTALAFHAWHSRGDEAVRTHRLEG